MSYISTLKMNPTCFFKRARINGTGSLRGGEIVVKAQVPLSKLEMYARS